MTIRSISVIYDKGNPKSPSTTSLISTNRQFKATILLVLRVEYCSFSKGAPTWKRYYALENLWPHSATPDYWIMSCCLFIHYIWPLCELCYEHVVYIWFHHTQPRKKIQENDIKFASHQSGQHIHSIKTKSMTTPNSSTEGVPRKTSRTLNKDQLMWT